jgi:protein-tyrosine phosphatase
VLVHCHQGVSRSCSLAIGYLMWAQNMTYQDAYEYVRQRRGICSPNPGFIGQLMLWRQIITEPHVAVRVSSPSLSLSPGWC